MPGGECPDPGPARAADIAAMATARIPLKVGLTMAHNWKANAADYEHECLVQVVGIDARGLVTTTSCPIGPTREIKVRSRRICWTDMFDSYLYLTENDDNLPETFVGTLLLNLSTASFAALKSKGETRHRFLSLYDPDFHFVQTDVEGVLKSDGPSTFSIIMNDRLVEVPIVEHHVDEGLVPDGQ